MITRSKRSSWIASFALEGIADEIAAISKKENNAKLPVVYHPGETLDEKLQEIGMGVKEFATRVSKPEKTIIAVLKGKSSITPDMAVAFEMVTKIPAHMWLRHQKSYDEFIARKKKRKNS